MGLGLGWACGRPRKVIAEGRGRSVEGRGKSQSKGVEGQSKGIEGERRVERLEHGARSRGARSRDRDRACSAYLDGRRRVEMRLDDDEDGGHVITHVQPDDRDEAAELLVLRTGKGQA